MAPDGLPTKLTMILLKTIRHIPTTTAMNISYVLFRMPAVALERIAIGCCFIDCCMMALDSAGATLSSTAVVASGVTSRACRPRVSGHTNDVEGDSAVLRNRCLQS